MKIMAIPYQTRRIRARAEFFCHMAFFLLSACLSVHAEEKEQNDAFQNNIGKSVVMDPLIPFLAIILFASMFRAVRKGRMLHWIYLFGMIGALSYHTIAHGADGVVRSISGLAIGTSLAMIPYIFGGLSDRHVKLMGVVGAVFGPAGAVITALFATATAGICSAAFLLIRSQTRVSLHMAIALGAVLHMTFFAVSAPLP